MAAEQAVANSFQKIAGTETFAPLTIASSESASTFRNTATMPIPARVTLVLAEFACLRLRIAMTAIPAPGISASMPFVKIDQSTARTAISARWMPA